MQDQATAVSITTKIHHRSISLQESIGTAFEDYAGRSLVNILFCHDIYT